MVLSLRQNKVKIVSVLLRLHSHFTPMDLNYVLDKVQAVARAGFEFACGASVALIKKAITFINFYWLAGGEDREFYPIYTLVKIVFQTFLAIGNKLDLIAVLILDFLSVLNGIGEEIIKSTEDIGKGITEGLKGLLKPKKEE